MSNVVARAFLYSIPLLSGLSKELRKIQAGENNLEMTEENKGLCLLYCFCIWTKCEIIMFIWKSLCAKFVLNERENT